MRTWPTIVVACASGFCVLLGGCRGADAEALRGPVSELSVHGAWARSADSGSSTEVFFMLANAAAVSDTLVSVSSVDAEESGLHISTQNGRTMNMTAVRTLPVPAADSVAFRPLGAHVMLGRVRRPLREGDSVFVKLGFLSGQTLDVSAAIRVPD